MSTPVSEVDRLSGVVGYAVNVGICPITGKMTNCYYKTPAGTTVLAYDQAAANLWMDRQEEAGRFTSGVGVTLVFNVTYPRGCGPAHLHREWGRNDEEARSKMESYISKLPKGCTATQIERRLGH